MDIKLRFSLVFSFVFLLLLCFFSFFVYMRLQNKLFSAEEQTLLSHLNHEWAHLEQHGDQARLGTLRTPDVYLRVWQDRALLYDSFPQEVKLPKMSKPIERIGDKIISTLRKEHGGNPYELVGYYDLKSTLVYLSTLSKILLLAFLIALIAILPLGWFLTKSLLRPFFLLSQKTSELGAEQLSFRFSQPKRLDEYGLLVMNFNALLERLKRAFNQTKRFSTNAAHELRTPLTVIRGEGEVCLRRDREFKEYKQTISRMVSETKVLQQIIDHLLMLSDLERTSEKKHRAPVEVRKVLADLSKTLGNKYHEKNIEISGNEITFLGYPELIMSVASNLLENALKFSTSVVMVTIGHDDRGLHLRVEDDGPGMKEEEKQEVFTPFFKGNAGRQANGVNQGHGLGLSIVKTCIDTVKGSVSLGRSQLGGLLVSVTFPSSIGVSKGVFEQECNSKDIGPAEWDRMTR